MTPLDDLPLYSAVRRGQIVEGLSRPIQARWRGDLLIGHGRAVVLARLGSETWQVLAPNTLRRQIRQSNDPTRRRPWSRLQMPADALLFLQRRPSSTYVYAGRVRNFPFGGHGVGGGGEYHRAWTDFEIHPALTDDLWKELQFHTLHIDGTLVELKGHKVIGSPEFSDALKAIRRRRRVTVSIYDRVRGTLTYSKRDGWRELIHEHLGSTRHATAGHEGEALDALEIYWSFGALLSRYLRWRARAGASDE